MVPTEFAVLVERIASRRLQDVIRKLLEEKQRGFEHDCGPAIPEISAFIETELARLGESEIAVPAGTAPIGPLNELFRATLGKAWN